MSIHIDGSLMKRVCLLAGPAMVGMLSHTLLSLIDTAMVGRLGADALAAVGIGGMVVYVLMSAFFAIDTGSRAIVSRYYGSGDCSNCGRITQQALLLALFCGLAVAAAGWFLSDDLFDLMGAEPQVATLGSDYLRYILPGAPFMFMSFAFNGLFTGLGNTKTPMYVMIIANGLNVILNYFLIYGTFGFPAMGVKGAAVATVIARMASIILFVIIVATRRSLQSYRPSFVPSLHWERMKQLIRISAPTSLEQVLWASGFLAFTAIIAQLGTVPLAANTIALNITMISFMPAHGIGVAASTLVGQNLGAGRFVEAERSGWTAALLGVGFMVFMGLVFFCVPEYLMLIFTSDRAVIASGAAVLKILAFFQLFDALQIVLGLALRGAADTRWVMICNLAITWLLFVPASYLFALPLGWGLKGAWWAFALFLLATGVAMTVRFHGGRWKEIAI